MFNSETLGFSNSESSPENLNENATNQQRGEMVNQAAAVQGETSQNNFASMSLKDLMNVDPNKRPNIREIIKRLQPYNVYILCESK